MKTRSRITSSIVLSLALGLVACQPHYIMVDGFKVDRPAWEKSTTQVIERASFELGCPKGEIRVTALDVKQAQAQTIGVEACGQRAVFVRAGTNWVMNSVSSPTAGEATSSAAE